jgi:hypothetical protein
MNLPVIVLLLAASLLFAGGLRNANRTDHYEPDRVLFIFQTALGLAALFAVALLQHAGLL